MEIINMEDKTVIITQVFELQQGKPYEFGVMIDGESKKISSWEKQDLVTGKTYSITLLDEDAKDVQYNQRRMKKSGKVELLSGDVQGTLEPMEPMDPMAVSEDTEVVKAIVTKVTKVIKTKPETPAPTPDLPIENKDNHDNQDDFDDEFMGMIEEEQEEQANDKRSVTESEAIDLNEGIETRPSEIRSSKTVSGDVGMGKTDYRERSQLAISNPQRSVLPINPNKLQLNIESIKILNPIATDENAMKFLQKCIWQNLNPFIGDCYLITYNNTKTGKQDMSMVVSKDVFLKRSASNPNYEGFEAGIIVRIGKELKLDYREGSVYIKGEEELIGGWAKVYIKGLRPIRAEVLVAEYHSGKALWLTKTSTMIRKVALSQAMREAHPLELQGFYDGSEIEANE